MSESPDTARRFDHAVVIDCWNSIGVRGDGSCPELKQHVHCRNCPVYSAGAAELLDGDLPANYLAEWTSHFAEPKRADEVGTRSILTFRLASEWLALPAAVALGGAKLLAV